MGRNQERQDKRSTHLDMMCRQMVCMKTDETPLSLDVTARGYMDLSQFVVPFHRTQYPCPQHLDLLPASSHFCRLYFPKSFSAGVNYSKISKQIYHQISTETVLLQRIFSCFLALLQLEMGSHNIKKVIKCCVFSHLRLDTVLNYVSTLVYIILKCDPSNAV